MNVLILVLIILSCFKHPLAGPVLRVFCSFDFIKLKIMFDYNYFGIIYTVPNRETCSVFGTGDTELSFYIPLKDPGRNQCGVTTNNKVHSVALAIRHHHIIETAKDYTFFVQCSDEFVIHQGELGEINVALNLFQDNRIVSNAVVGHRYKLQITVPKHYEISACIAFTVAPELRYYNLLNERGCPLDETILTPFNPGSQNRLLQAQLTMFRFNGSHEFNIQCSIIKCNDEPCRDRNCVKYTNMDNLLYDSTGQKEQIFINTALAIAAARLTVRDSSKTNEIKKFVGCHYSEQPELIGLTFVLVLLILLTIMLTITAFHNRPFRCHWHPRDSPITEDIVKIEDCRSRSSLLPRSYRPRSTVSTTGSKTSCEQNRETTIVKEIIMTTIPTPEICVQSILSPRSSPSSTLKSRKTNNELNVKLKTGAVGENSRHTNLMRNKSFLSAVAELKLANGDHNENDCSGPAPPQTKQPDKKPNNSKNVDGLFNFYETPSNKPKIDAKRYQKKCRTHSPLYVNVDSSLSSICPINTSIRRKSVRSNNSSLSGKIRI